MDRKRNITIAGILAAAAIAAMALYVLYIAPKFVIPADTYAEAKKLYNTGNYMNAALKLESIGSYADSKQLAQKAWKLAGDVAYNEGNFDAASTCYLKGNASEEDIRRIDECYMSLAESAFAKEQASRGEIYLNCVHNKTQNAQRIDNIRIDGIANSLKRNFEKESVESAIERLGLCSEESYEKIVQTLIDGGTNALKEQNADSAHRLFAAAASFCSKSSLADLKKTIVAKWTEAGKRAKSAGDNAFADICFAKAGNPDDYDEEVTPGNEEETYIKAMHLYDSGNRAAALKLFSYLRGYKNVDELVEKILENIASSISAGSDGCYAELNTNGTINLVGSNWKISAPRWNDIKSIAVSGENFVIAVRENGSVLSVGEEDVEGMRVESWNNIEKAVCGMRHTIALREDGTVISTGEGEEYANTGNWRGIVSIAAGDDTSYGVKKDGTVVAVGKNDIGQCEVSDWRSVTEISAGKSHVVGMLTDGTAVACGDNDLGQCEVSEWNNLIGISAGSTHTVGVRKDGTLVACGSNDNGECDVASVRDAVAVFCGDGFTVAVLRDGTVVFIGR